MEIRVVQCKTAASRSRLPGLDWAVNPYRGCAHGCSYCYAQDVTRFELGRPWGQVCEVKANIVDVLKKELSRGARGVYGIGTVTDPYQPVEERHQLTRGCLAVLKQKGASVSVLTKSPLVLRDLDLLRDWEGAEVGMSVGTMDTDVARVIEPGAPGPERRFEALRALSDAGVEVYLMAAPIVPGLSDADDMLKMLVAEARAANVKRIMWDMYNPRPAAVARMREALIAAGLEPLRRAGPSDVDRVRQVLTGACAEKGVELVSAF